MRSNYFIRPTVGDLIFGTSTLHHLLLSKDRCHILKNAFEVGVSCFDTSPFYGDGLAESCLADVFGDVPDLVRISTKIGLDARGMRPGSIANTITVKFVQKLSGQRMFSVRLPNSSRFAYESIARSVGESFARLGRIRTDTLFLHEPYASEWPQIESVLPFLTSLIKSGDVKQIGLSGYAMECLSIQKESGHFFSKLQIEDDPFLTQSSLLQRNGVSVDAVFGVLRTAYAAGSSLSASQIFREAYQRSPGKKFLFSTTKVQHLKNLISGLSDGN